MTNSDMKRYLNIHHSLGCYKRLTGGPFTTRADDDPRDCLTAVEAWRDDIHKTAAVILLAVPPAHK
jgi:hypothetical protein